MTLQLTFFHKPFVLGLSIECPVRTVVIVIVLGEQLSGSSQGRVTARWTKPLRGRR